MRSAILLLVIMACGCAKLPGHSANDYDPNRPFHYGAMQFEEGRKAFILTEQSLERDDQVWPLVIYNDLRDDQRICVEVGMIDGHLERCLTLGELRAWLRK